MPVDELKLKIDDIRKDIEKKFELYAEWETDQHLLFRRKGIKGSIEIDELGFQLTLKLSMMYRSMRAQIEREIVNLVDRHLSE